MAPTEELLDRVAEAVDATKRLTDVALVTPDEIICRDVNPVFRAHLVDEELARRQDFGNRARGVAKANVVASLAEALDQAIEILWRCHWIAQHHGGAEDPLVGKKPGFIAEMFQPRLKGRRIGLREVPMLAHERDAEFDRYASHHPSFRNIGAGFALLNQIHAAAPDCRPRRPAVLSRPAGDGRADPISACSSGPPPSFWLWVCGQSVPKMQRSGAVS